MKILFIHSSSNNLAGSEMVLTSLMENLKECYDIQIVLPETGIFHRYLKDRGASVQVVPLHNFTRNSPGPYLKSLWNLYKAFQQLKPDLVHITSASPMQYSFPITRLLRIPLVCHIQCPYGQDDLRRYFPQKADRVIVVSNALRKIFAEKYLSKLEVVYNGISIPDLNKEKETQILRSEFGLPDDTRVVCIVGQIIRRKGIDIFLKAFADSKRTHPKFKALIVGNNNTEYGSLMKNLAGELGVESDVIWTGYQINPQQIIAGSDMLVMPSREEGFGLAAAEAGAVGTPVIASNTGGLNEIVAHGVNGFLFAEEDPGRLKYFMQTLLNNPGLASDMGRMGRKKIKNSFSVSNQILQIKNIYHEIAS